MRESEWVKAKAYAIAYTGLATSDKRDLVNAHNHITLIVITAIASIYIYYS